MAGAKEYGKALFLITEELGLSDKIITDVKTAESLLKSNPDYVKLLCSPALSKEERVRLADGAFGSLDERLVNLIKILTERRSLHLFNRLARVYYDLYDTSRGIIRVEAITAVSLTPQQIKAMTDRLERPGRTVIIKNTVDKNILGGVKLRYSVIQLDGSIKTRLSGLELAIRETVIQ